MTERTEAPVWAPARVEAYAGHRGMERPIAFILEGRRLTVAAVLDRWYQGGLSPRDQSLDYFKVSTVEGREYLLRYNPLFDCWSARDLSGR